MRLVSILKRQFGMPLAAKPVVRGKLAETLVSVAARHVVRGQVALVMGENENSAPFWRRLQPKADMIFALAASKPLGKRGGELSFAAS